MRRALLAVALVALIVPAACESGAPPVPAGTDAATTPERSASRNEGWPAPGAGAVNVRRERSFDLTGDGRAERVIVLASGARYDSLAISLRIEDDQRRTLWAEDWNSSYYFHYDTADGRTADDIADTVQGHVDALVGEQRFHPRGMPPGLIRGDASETIRESVQYHLAELDWRRGASLDPADPTPQEAYRRIRPESVVQDRVQVVQDELMGGPTYQYFAGGEATYVIGWSEREQAFVRLFACC